MGRSGETPSKKASKPRAGKDPRPPMVMKQFFNDDAETEDNYSKSFGQGQEAAEHQVCRGQATEEPSRRKNRQGQAKDKNGQGQEVNGQGQEVHQTNFSVNQAEHDDRAVSSRVQRQAKGQEVDGRAQEGPPPPTTATTDNPVSSNPLKAHIPAITLDSNATSFAFLNQYKADHSPKFFEARLSADRKLIVRVSCLDDYRTLQSSALKANIPFTIFKLKEEKPFQVVIKNIPSFITPTQVREELFATGYTCESVSQVTNLKTGRKLPIFNVTMDNNEKNRKIYELKTFMNMVVLVEKRHPPTKLLQCYNCQEFNHGSAQCKRSLACLHCSGQHDHRSCPHKHADGVQSCEHCKCANCSGNHPTVSLQCPIKANLLKKREYTSNQVTKQLQQIRSRTPFAATRPPSRQRSRSVSRRNTERSVAWQPTPQVDFEEAKALPYKAKSTTPKPKTKPKRKRSASTNSTSSVTSSLSYRLNPKIPSVKPQQNSSSENTQANFLFAALQTAIKLIREARPDTSLQELTEEVLKLPYYIQSHDDYMNQIKLLSAKFYNSTQ